LITAFLLVSSPSLRADALDNWTLDQIIISPAGDAGLGSQPLSVVYGSGRYVAVGQYVEDDYGVVETSEDGVNWTTRSGYGSVLDLYDVTFGNGVFVAVGWDWYGGANLYSSTNGINWTSHTTKISNFYGVTYGGGLFVAVSDGYLLGTSNQTNRNIYTSPDGITWTARNSGSPVTDVHSIRDVAYGAGRFVAVDGQGYFYTSTTGSTWTRSYTSNAGGRVSYCNSLFIVPAGSGANLVSADGLTWSLLMNNTASTFGRVIYTNGLYAALSGTNVFTSTNGTNWIPHSLPTPTNVNLSEITFGNRNIMAVGYTYPPLPMVPVAYISDSIVAVGMKSGFPPQLSISGLQGRSYRIECADTLPGAANHWWTNTTVQLPGSPYNWTDTTATNSQRFYRAVLLP